ncbi:MAG: nitrate reductase associated protein [Cyanobacteriota bacterium]
MRASQCFRFEEDFTASLRCIPMAVRRKLDLAGVKLKLVHWAALDLQDRQRLLDWPDQDEAVQALRAWLLERTAALPDGPARLLPPACAEPWQQREQWPDGVVRSADQLGLVLRPEGWQRLEELQRFALVKLSHPGHEHRNLPRALQEFGLIEP